MAIGVMGVLILKFNNYCSSVVQCSFHVFMKALKFVQGNTPPPSTENEWFHSQQMMVTKNAMYLWNAVVFPPITVKIIIKLSRFISLIYVSVVLFFFKWRQFVSGDQSMLQIFKTVTTKVILISCVPLRYFNFFQILSLQLQIFSPLQTLSVHNLSVHWSCDNKSQERAAHKVHRLQWLKYKLSWGYSCLFLCPLPFL